MRGKIMSEFNFWNHLNFLLDCEIRIERYIRHSIDSQWNDIGPSDWRGERDSLWPVEDQTGTCDSRGDSRSAQ